MFWGTTLRKGKPYLVEQKEGFELLHVSTASLEKAAVGGNDVTRRTKQSDCKD
jgi:hypothetical protein